MAVGFDPFAFALAILVAVLAIAVFRRGHAIVLKILHVASAYTQDPADNHGKPYWEFRIVVQNAGISLHNVRLCIRFRARGTGAQITVPLYRYSPIANALVGDRDGEFAHGMVADFRLRTHWLDQEIGLLAALEDPIAQEARLCMYAEGCFLAGEWKIGVGLDNVKRRWNEMTARLNLPSGKQVAPNGAEHPSLKARHVFGQLPSLYWPVREFTAAARKLRKEPPGPTARTPITVFTADDGASSNPSFP